MANPKKMYLILSFFHDRLLKANMGTSHTSNQQNKIMKRNKKSALK